jgi:hypothetical protein
MSNRCRVKRAHGYDEHVEHLMAMLQAAIDESRLPDLSDLFEGEPDGSAALLALTPPAMAATIVAALPAKIAAEVVDRLEGLAGGELEAPLALAARRLEALLARERG